VVVLEAENLDQIRERELKAVRGRLACNKRKTIFIRIILTLKLSGKSIRSCAARKLFWKPVKNDFGRNRFPQLTF